MITTKLKVADLFAGAGGFSLAAVQAGCEIVFAVEFDKNAATTYRDNIGAEGRSKGVVVYDEDITKLSATGLAERHFPGADCDLLLGGPPCQGFSAHRINDAGVDDPRNALIHEYFDFVRSLKPKAFLMENVPGMLWPRHKSYLDEFYRQARDSGYTVYAPQKLDARDYGIPQRRQRVFILGVREEDLVEISEASDVLKVGVDAIRGLYHSGHLLTCRVRNPATGRLNILIKRETMLAFDRHYVSSSELCRQLRVPNHRSRTFLDFNLEPAVRSQSPAFVFYLRSDLERLQLAI